VSRVVRSVAVRYIHPPTGKITMAGLPKVFSSMCRNTSGATAIEYGFIAMLISVVAVAAMNSIGSWTAASFEAVASGL